MRTAQSYTRHDVSFTSGKDTCAAWLYLPTGVTSPPVIILGHGLGATREMRLDAFAERFAQSGIAALAFTYRHFGDSGGQPRQLLSIKRQLADWDAAIAWVKDRSDVDGTRIAVWGSSFGGGHSITVASRHPELKAAVAQCPFTDGLASALALGPGESLKVLPSVARDVASMVFRRSPAMIPLAGPPGSLALMNAPDALPGYEALLPPDTTFRNEVAARVAPTIANYRPGRAAKKIKFPILFCVSDTDSVTPPAQTLRYARTAPRGEIKRYDAGHFAFYLGEPFEALVRDQVEFLSRQLQPAGHKDPPRAAHLKDIRMTSLHDPLTLPCGQVLPNRIMKAALSEGLGDRQNSPDERLERLYTSWSQGGYGLIVTGNVMVDRRQLGEPGNVVIEDERNLDALSRWAKSTKDAGVPVWVQLNHPGRQSNPLALGHTPVAPSAVALNLPGAATPRELTSTEIEDIIERFAAAAAVCETAGFDGVQIHGAHGYLIAQFLSPLSNQRDDQWGGDPERRMRFVLEVVRRIRARVSPGFAVGIKLNSADFQRGGFTEDESRSVVGALAGESIDLIEVSGGSYEQPAMMGKAADSTRAREAYFLEYARTVRSLAGDIPLAVTGGFRSRAAMHEAVHAGECDVIGLGRPTATTTDAADVILAGRAATLPSHQLRAGMRGILGKFVDLKSLDGILELSWHADQLHRVGAGLTPDLNRGRIATTVAMVRRNGTTSFGRKRGL